MKATQQPLDRMRKQPAQKRARETVEIIFEATARILERDGRAAFNTNAVAELAGISIGTLYHYFQSKDAILIAMARCELQAHQAAVARAISEAEGVRGIVKALIHASGRRLRARQIAMDTLITHGLGAELAIPLRAIVKVLEARQAAALGLPPAISATTLFVLTRAVSGVLNAAVREGSPPCSGVELEDELVRLIEAYLTPEQLPLLPQARQSGE
jgi:AcrR family transcriptional regulator